MSAFTSTKKYIVTLLPETVPVRNWGSCGKSNVTKDSTGDEKAKGGAGIATVYALTARIASCSPAIGYFYHFVSFTNKRSFTPGCEEVCKLKLRQLFVVVMLDVSNYILTMRRT